VDSSYKDAPTRTVSAGGADLVYRDLGPKAGVPVISERRLDQHRIVEPVEQCRSCARVLISVEQRVGDPVPQ
jgi:hypothetical protein